MRKFLTLHPIIKHLFLIRGSTQLGQGIYFIATTCKFIHYKCCILSYSYIDTNFNDILEYTVSMLCYIILHLVRSLNLCHIKTMSCLYNRHNIHFFRDPIIICTFYRFFRGGIRPPWNAENFILHVNQSSVYESFNCTNYQ